MSKKLTTEEFIKRCNNVHGTRYNYQKTEYVDSQTKITVTCPLHGDWRCLPLNHTHLKQGCPSCGRTSSSNKRTVPFDTFVKRACDIHNNKYMYVAESYTNTNRKTSIICPRHGEFKMSPNAHVSAQQGCPQCAHKHKTNQQWIDDFMKVHGDTYDYSQTVVTTSHKHTTVICKEHGPFNQSPAMHRSGQGCPKCAYINHHGRYSHQYFRNHPKQKQKPAVLYVWEITNAHEHFIKVGITTTSVTKRINNNKTTSYNIVVKCKLSMPLYDAFILEQKLVDAHRAFKYTPKEHFQGRTECLLPSCYEQLINLIQESKYVK